MNAKGRGEKKTSWLFIMVFQGPLTKEASKEMSAFLKHLETEDNIKVLALHSLP